MSAEIIQFGKAQSISAKSKPAAKKSVQRRVRYEPEPEPQREAVRCTVDDRLYEVEFYGKSVTRISAIHYRCNGRNGRIETLRYSHWYGSGWGRYGDPDPDIVEAARRARGQVSTGSDREAAIAQLGARHARLMRDAEKVEATIASLQREIN
jgi:hypothetical protein